MTLGRLEKRVAALTHRRTPPAAPMGRREMAAALGFRLDEWQVEALESPAPAALWNVARQSGKSTLAALRALHLILSAPGSLVLIVSPTERQSTLLYRRLAGFYRQLGRPVPAIAETRLSLELSNGSSVFALPGDPDTTRGFAGVGLLILDEAARIADEMVGTVRPMLAVSGGAILALSTPNGRVGWFWEAWEHGGSDWARWHVTASQNPRISPAWLAQERRALPDSVYGSEYLAEFLDADDSAFRGEDIDRAFSPDVRPLFAREVA